jgi:hypothetical protein
MKRVIQWLLAVLLILGTVTGAVAFSLLGPFKDGTQPGAVSDPWQSQSFGGRPRGLGYNPLNMDIGGPMFPHEAYRWNVPVVTYAFDQSFIAYFGTNGIIAVEKALKILNDLPAASKMSTDLTEFPLDNKQNNPMAGALGLLDIKSHALSLIIEELGLANPERFVWSLRSRVTGQNFTNYAVLKLNYDPVTLAPSSFVNGVLYSYQIEDALGPTGGEWASAVEFFYPDPFFLPYSSVAGGLSSPDFQFGSQPSSFVASGLAGGDFFRGLTRDDVGGLRFLLNPNNIVTESLQTNVTGRLQAVTSLTSPWIPVIGTNFVTTNAFGQTNVITVSTNLPGTNLITQGLRGGVDKIQFRRVNFDSLLGQTFVPVATPYTDTVIINGRPFKQTVVRAVQAPDIIFVSEDLGVDNAGVPILVRRSPASGWANNNLANGITTAGGPGVVLPTVVIRFSDNPPYFLKGNPFDTSETAFDIPVVWGSFDGSTNAPIVYPKFLNYTLEDLANQVLGVGTNAPAFP